MISDKWMLITGSYNFSYNAQYRNAENLLVITCKPITQKYLVEFSKHINHATKLP